MFKKKPTASEVDGVQYRRAKLWQIICYACNGLVGMSVYSLIGMASYSASIGYGITTAAVGIILTCSRILDGITDPLLAFVYDRVNTKFGKLRILMVAGFLIEALALYGMFTGFSSKGLGLPVFALLYIVYIIGYTINTPISPVQPARSRVGQSVGTSQKLPFWLQTLFLTSRFTASFPQVNAPVTAISE